MVCQSLFYDRMFLPLFKPDESIGSYFDFLDLQFGRNWFLSTEASSLRTSIQQQLYRLFNQEILDRVQANNQSVSNGDTGGVCEVVLPLDGQAVCE